MKITIDDVLEPKNLYDIIHEAIQEATIRGIKANSIVINRGLVFVPGDPGVYPDMVCGLKSYVTAKDLPEEYAFAVLHDPNREPQSGWIPVTERLPIEEAKAYEKEWEDYPEYIVMIDRGCLPTTLYYDWENNVWFKINSALKREEYKVTHWMPLPDPPKEE